MTISDFLLSANEWIANHQVLFVAAGIPILTAGVTAFISWRTTHSIILAQNKERELARAIKLADFRQDWINSMRDDLAAYSALGWKSELQADVPFQRERLSLLSRILMRMNPADPDYPALKKSLQDPIGKPSESIEALAIIGQRFLKREWDRLKKDLSSIEEKR